MASIRTVVLGPEIDLHPGIHASLVQTPPPGFDYVTRPATHVFVHPRHAFFSPVCHRHWGEFVDFGSGRRLVHSSRWPVLGRRSWVVELDDLGYPAYSGRHALAPSFRRAFRRPWTTAFARDILRRVEVTLTAYSHPSCQAVLFRTRRAIEDACRSLVDLRLESWLDKLIAKSAVLYPATQTISEEEFDAKWSGGLQRLRLVFCGRDFAAKDGALALRVVGRLLAAGHDFEFTYVGMIPPEEQRKFCDVLGRIRFFNSLTRSAVLRLFKKSHILFHPSPRESVGMVFIEAAAAGLAVVASYGPGLLHLTELLPPRGARSVDRSRGTRRDQERDFERLLATLLRQPAEARQMARTNYRNAVDGPISLHQRNDMLATIYGASLRSPAGAPLTLNELDAGELWGKTRMSSQHLDALIADYRRRVGVHELAIFV